MLVNRLTPWMTRIVVGVVVAALLIGGGFYLLSGGNTKTVSANFSSGVGVYPGTPVKVLGINVGEVINVKPAGAYVRVTMTYDSKYKLPGGVKGLIVANSLVSDRYIQLAPACSTHPIDPVSVSCSGAAGVAPDHYTIPESQTAAPAELDDIYAALSKLSLALGPNGANKDGALSNFIAVSQANLQGNGAAFGQSISKLSQAIKTLANGRTDLFGTVKNLQSFTNALNNSDANIRKVEQELAQVAGDLASERGDLGAALHNLSIALDQVGTFVRTNAAKTHTDLQGLSNIARILVKEQSSLNETLAVGPAALANLVHTYQPDLGVIASRGNLSSLLDPGAICDALNVLDFSGKLGAVGQNIANLLKLLGVGNILGNLTLDIATTCNTLIAKKGGTKLPAGTTQAQAKSMLQSLLVSNSPLGGLLPGS